jgi:hypothetical protein
MENNIKIDVKEKWYGVVEWIQLIQDDVNTVMNIRFPHNA